MRYILASKSPRRKDLMKYISSDFLIAIEDIDESSSYNLSPVEAVKDIAKRNQCMQLIEPLLILCTGLYILILVETIVLPFLTSYGGL